MQTWSDPIDTAVTRPSTAAILVVRAPTRTPDGHPAVRASTLSRAWADAQPVPDPSWPRPRAVVLEIEQRADDIGAMLAFVRDLGLFGHVPTVLAAPLGVIRRVDLTVVDDFLVIPYGVDEAIERIRRIEQRRRSTGHRRVDAGRLRLDLDCHEATLDGRAVHLTRLELALLSYLVRHPERVFARDELLSRVWGYERADLGRTVDIHVRRLRAKLGDAAAIETVRGIGYRFRLGTGARNLEPSP